MVQPSPGRGGSADTEEGAQEDQRRKSDRRILKSGIDLLLRTRPTLVDWRV